MANAVAARMQGDDYQSRYFWLRALDAVTCDYVEAVELESIQATVVDDVVVHYRDPGKQDAGGRYSVDYCQLKYHLTAQGAFSLAALLDPNFTTTKEPILTRLYRAYGDLAVQGKALRLRVVSPWPWHPDDVLAPCLATEGHFREDFFSAKPTTKVGKERMRAAKALGITEDQFSAFFRLVRFTLGGNLETFALALDGQFKLAQLMPFPQAGLHNAYDDLARKLIIQRRHRFTGPELMALLRSEGLVAPKPSDRGQVSLVSRPEWAKKPLPTQSRHLDLCHLFSGRHPSTATTWAEVARSLREFISPDSLGDLPQPVEVFFDCHLSIACAAGSLLPSKAGLHLVPVQKVPGRGYEAWGRPQELSAASTWVIEGARVGEGEALVAVSVTHDVRPSVMAYASQHGLGKHPLISLRTPVMSPVAVKDAAQAWVLGMDLRSKLRSFLSPACRLIHLFYSGPAALMFLIGAHSGGLPPIQLYEHDYEGTDASNSYAPSLTIPLPPAVSPGSAKHHGG